MVNNPYDDINIGLEWVKFNPSYGNGMANNLQKSQSPTLSLSEMMKAIDVWDVDATALFARMSASLTYADKYAINALFAGIKADNSLAPSARLNTIMDAMWFTCAGTTADFYLNWVQNAYNLVAVGSPTLTLNTCYTPSAGNYLKTSFNPTVGSPVFVQNSASVGVYLLDNITEDLFHIGGVNVAFSGTLLAAKRVTTGTYLQLDSIAGANSTTGVTTSKGLRALSRVDSVTITRWGEGVNLGGNAVASVAPTNIEFYLGCYNNNGVQTSPNTNRTALGYIAGGVIDQAKLNTRVQAYLTYKGIAV